MILTIGIGEHTWPRDVLNGRAVGPLRGQCLQLSNRIEADLVLANVRLTDDLKSARAILVKGWLFLALGLLSAGMLLVMVFSIEVLLLLLISLWAFCRWYYFMFYVIEKYVDPSFKFAGLGSFLRYRLKARSDNERN